MLEQLHPIVREDISAIIEAQLPWGLLENRTVLITGANGFLANYLFLTLLALNDNRKLNMHLIALVRDADRALTRFGSLLKRSDVTTLVQDVAQPIPSSMRPNFLIHAASQASPKFYLTDPVGTIAANTLGTHNILQHAVQCNAERVLFFSSSEVYGDTSQYSAIEELKFGPLDPAFARNCYAEGKRAGEAMCVAFYKQFNLNSYIVRPFHTYGPGMDLYDGRVFADFVRHVVSCSNIEIHSDGRAKRAFCYLRDATEGFLRVLLTGEPAVAYNIGNPQEEYSVRELAELLVQAFPERNLKVDMVVASSMIKESQSLVSRILPDITRARGLGWQPKMTAHEGFSRTVRSFE
jgi:nucleoside-diphosphate-sugar epimerase